MIGPGFTKWELSGSKLEHWGVPELTLGNPFVYLSKTRVVANDYTTSYAAAPLQRKCFPENIQQDVKPSYTPIFPSVLSLPPDWDT